MRKRNAHGEGYGGKSSMNYEELEKITLRAMHTDYLKYAQWWLDFYNANKRVRGRMIRRLKQIKLFACNLKTTMLLSNHGTK
jgi:hypothetical protein